MRLLSSLLLLFSVLGIHTTDAQTIIAAFSATPEPTTEVVAGGTITATALSRGAGVTNADIEDPVGFQSYGWATADDVAVAIAGDHYIEWTVTAVGTNFIDVTSISLSYNREIILAPPFGDLGVGPKQFVIRSSVDNFSSEVYSDFDVQFTTETATFSTFQRSPEGGSITYRLYGYESETGFGGLNQGTLDVTGDLPTPAGFTLADVGITLTGTIENYTLVYENDVWTPNAPSAITGTENVVIKNGTYNIASDIIINDLQIDDSATIIVAAGTSLTINGNANILSAGSLQMNSISNSYSSVIPNASISGNVIYKRWVNHTAASTDNDLIAPPVSGESFSDFVTTNTNIINNANADLAARLYLFGPFNKTTGQYDLYSGSTTTALEAGLGYRAATTGTGGTLTFTGNVATGAVTQSIVTSGPSFSKANLIGNPYPSYIRLDEFLTENNANLDDTFTGIYGYDGDESNGWTVWNDAYLAVKPNALITPGQGFFVISGINGANVAFTDVMRSTGSSDDFILGRSSSDEMLSYIKLNLATDTKNYHTDFYFNPNASLGLDKGYDAAVIRGTPSPFSIHSYLIEEDEGTAMAIQSLSNNTLNNISIPLGINANAGVPLTISLSENILPTAVEVYLDDTVLNASTLLNSNDYVFTPNANEIGNGRFFLRLVDNSVLSVTDNNLDALNIYTNQLEKTIVVSGQLLEPTTLTVYDVQGRAVLNKTLIPNANQQLLNVQSLHTGVYIVTLSNTKQSSSSKIILN